MALFDTPQPQPRLYTIETDGRGGKASKGVVGASVLAVCAVCALLYRIELVRPQAMGPIAFGVFQRDAAIVGALFIGYAISVALDKLIGRTPRVAAWTIRVLLLSTLAIYLADILALKFFYTRLYLNDVAEFGMDYATIASLSTAAVRVALRQSLWQLAALAGLLAMGFLATVTYLASQHRLRRNMVLGIGLAGVGMVGFSTLPPPAGTYSYADKLLYQNLVERNAALLGGDRYSPAFKDDLVRRFDLTTTCRSGQGRPSNIIVILVEGLSSYHSNLFSGINDFTPRLDSLAKNGLAFTNFFANGWTTRGGLLAILSETIPIVREQVGWSRWGTVTFEDYDSSRNLAALLKDEGYVTTFLTTGDLSFTDKGPWLRTLGFDVIEGHDSELYDAYPRGIFSAAPDTALYLRALQLLRHQQQGDRPFGMVLETVSSHQPYRAPDGSRDTEENVIRYADRQLGVFVDSLEARDFFSDGLLLVLGDHRAMTPITPAEIEFFGQSSIARVPLIVIGDSVASGTEQQLFQQIDILPSIEATVADSVCRSPHQGLLLGPERESPPYVLHAMGRSRRSVYVYTGTEEAIIRTDGDGTSTESGDVTQESEIIDLVNSLRIRR